MVTTLAETGLNFFLFLKVARLTVNLFSVLSLYKDILLKSPQRQNSNYEFEVRFREEKINKQTYDDIFKTLRPKIFRFRLLDSGENTNK